jgi:hypothetical protein
MKRLTSPSEKGSEFKEYVKEHAKMRELPFVDFEIDSVRKIGSELMN